MLEGVVLINLFDEAQKEIFDLMSTDSFPRYQASQFYRALLEDVNQQNREMRAIGLITDALTTRDDQFIHAQLPRVGLELRHLSPGNHGKWYLASS